MKVAQMLVVPVQTVLPATNTIVASTGATSTVALVLTPVLAASSTGATNNVLQASMLKTHC